MKHQQQLLVLRTPVGISKLLSPRILASKTSKKLFASLVLGCLLFSSNLVIAQETTSEDPSTDLESVQAIIEQAMQADNQLVQLISAQVQAAEAAQQEIVSLQASLQAKNDEIASLEAETNSLKLQTDNLASELEGSTVEITALQNQMVERANELQVVIQERDIIQSAFARVQDASDKGKVRIEELEALLTETTTTTASLETQVKTLEAQYQAALIGAEVISEEAVKLPALQAQVDELSTESAKLKNHIDRVTNSRERLKIQHERTLLQIDSFEQNMTDAIFRANTLEAQLRTADTASSGQVQTLRQQYADAQSQIFSLEGSLEGARAEVERLQTLVNESVPEELTENLSAKDEEINSLKDQVATLRTTIINLPNSDKLLSLQQERDALQQELDSVKAQLAAQQANGTNAASDAVAATNTTEGATAAGTAADVVNTVAAAQETQVLAAPTAASELPSDVDGAKEYAILKLNEYYQFRDRVTDLGANVSLLELNQREEALINFQEAQSNVAALTNAEIYRVAPGDTLSDISSSLYGSSNRWQDILANNSYIINDPDVIFPGFELVIPQ